MALDRFTCFIRNSEPMTVKFGMTHAANHRFAVPVSQGCKKLGFSEIVLGFLEGL